MLSDKNVLKSTIRANYPVIDHGEGAYLFDKEGKRYLDFAAGIAVANIGHGVKEVADAIYEQMTKVAYVYGGTFLSEKRMQLAQQIAEMAPEGLNHVFFCSGGSEAMESVMKISRQYWIEAGKPSKHKIIGRWQSYHGNTMATLALGGRPSWRAPYEDYGFASPHVAQCNCYRCPFGLEKDNCGLLCAEELERIINYEGPETVAAFVLEPIIGTTASATIPPIDYIRRIREICDKYDVLLCFDEVITGYGRTGKNFAADHFGVVPDIIGSAKGLGCGYAPIGAVIVSDRIVDTIADGSGKLVHSFTFSGNPVACASASAVLDYIKKHDLVKRSAEMGALFLSKLKTLENLPCVGEVRGIGMMYGVEFVRNKKTKEPFPAEFGFCAKLVKYCFERGLMVSGGVPGTVDGHIGEALQIAPPFIITEEQMDFAVSVLRDGIQAVLDEAEQKKVD